MGQYRLALYFCYGIGAYIAWEPSRSLIVRFPFLEVYVGLTRYARGVRLFRDDFFEDDMPF